MEASFSESWCLLLCPRNNNSNLRGWSAGLGSEAPMKSMENTTMKLNRKKFFLHMAVKLNVVEA
jgi:hypothetical protein